MTAVSAAQAKALLTQATNGDGTVDLDRLRELAEKTAIPEFIDFKYYLHDDYDTDERIEFLKDCVPAISHLADDHEIFEQLGRPFYEVTLNCQWNTKTGEVTILSATT